MNLLFSLLKNRMIRIILVVLIVVGGIVGYLKFQEAQNPVCKDCNLILISVDTLRPDHMGVYGYNKNTTPNIDKWAKTSSVYTNTYAEVPMTYPSFVSLMTGKDAVETGIYSNRIVTDPNGNALPITSDTVSSSFETLAEVLKKNNYYNVAFVSNPVLSEEVTNLNRGFDKYQTINKTSPKQYEEFMVTNPLRLIKTNTNKKIFLWLHFIDPHSPYFAPKDYRCKFNKTSCQAINKLGFEGLENQRKQLEGCQESPLDAQIVDIYKTLYDEEIAYTDMLIGKILNALKENNMMKNTIVIFYSDHGEGFDHNYYFNHPAVLFNSTTKIVFMLKSPKNKSGFYTELTQNSDIYHLILQNLGIEKNNLQKRKYAYGITINKGAFSSTDGKYKYIEFLSNSCNPTQKKEVLYNLKIDPEEKIDILEKEPNKARELKEALKNHLSREGVKKNGNRPLPNISESTIEAIKSLGY